jgi:release factor glutamine methyltransferase
MNTVGAALAAARAQLPLAEARLLLGHLLQRPLAWLIAHDDAPLDASQVSAFAALVRRRAEGEPIAYLTGSREFFGHDFAVGPGVLIPRPETELLVEQALRFVQGTTKVGAGGPARILDLGTGSGCIAISIALATPEAAVTAVDQSPAALSIARNNAIRLDASVSFLASDWFGALADQSFDLIVSNPPYIADGDTHLGEGDLRFEPSTALASGADGLDAIRRIIAGAPGYLNPGGELWLEHGYDQATGVRSLLQAGGFEDVASQRDLAGIERISGGRLP